MPSDVEPKRVTARERGRDGEIGVLLLRGHDRLLTDALYRALSEVPSIRLCGRPAPEREASDALSDRDPQVVVLDAVGSPLPRVAGRVRDAVTSAPFVRVLVLASERSHDRCLVAAIDAGAWGVLSPGIEVDDLLEVIRRTARGERLVDAEQYLRAVQTTSRLRAREEQARSRLVSLTEREREVLTCLMDGCGTKDVADRFRISSRTVDTHVQHILRKLGVHTRTDAVRLGLHASARVLRDSA